MNFQDYQTHLSGVWRQYADAGLSPREMRNFLCELLHFMRSHETGFIRTVMAFDPAYGPYEPETPEEEERGWQEMEQRRERYGYQGTIELYHKEWEEKHPFEARLGTLHQKLARSENEPLILQSYWLAETLLSKVPLNDDQQRRVGAMVEEYCERPKTRRERVIRNTLISGAGHCVAALGMFSLAASGLSEEAWGTGMMVALAGFIAGAGLFYFHSAQKMIDERRGWAEATLAAKPQEPEQAQELPAFTASDEGMVMEHQPTPSASRHSRAASGR